MRRYSVHPFLLLGGMAWGLAGLIAVFLVAFAASPMPTMAAETALLGEMVPWPLMSAGTAAKGMPLSDEPRLGVCRPSLSGPEVRFGAILLADGSGPGVACAVLDQGERPPMLLVDTNNNEDLRDDSWRRYDQRTDLNTYNWLIEVMVTFDVDGIVSRVPFELLITARSSPQAAAYEWFYGGYCQRRGVALIDGVAYRMAMTNLQTTGGYGNPGTVVTSVDIDRNGILDTLPCSHEVFGPGEPVVLADGRAYRIDSIRPDGTVVELKPIGTAAPPEIVAPGSIAPPFQVTSHSGELVALTGENPAVTLLFFSGSPRTSSCDPGDEGTFALPARVEDTLRFLPPELQESGSLRVIVLTDRPLGTGFRFLSPNLAPVYVAYAPDVIARYRRPEGLLIVDRRGVIQAMDQFWYTFSDGHPIVKYHTLEIDDIASIVDALTTVGPSSG